MNKTHEDSKVIDSYYRGCEAFKAGKERIPANDQKFLDNVLKGLKVGEGLPYIKAWLKGWDNSNLGIK